MNTYRRLNQLHKENMKKNTTDSKTLSMSIGVVKSGKTYDYIHEIFTPLNEDLTIKLFIDPQFA